MSVEAAIRSALSLDEELIATPLARAGRRVGFPAGHLVFQQGGDPGDGLYVVLSGAVRVFQVTPEGEIDLGTVEAGDMFGAVALLDQGPRTASVATITSCEMLQLTRPAFEECLAGLGVPLTLRVLESLSGQLRRVSEHGFRQQLRAQALHAEMEMERHRALTSLVAGVAHEINTPLGIAGTALSVIASRLPSLATGAPDSEAAADVREAVELAQRNLRRADELVMRFKMVSAGQVADVLEEMDFVEAVIDAVELYRPAARRARLEVTVEDEVPAEARRWRGYRGYLAQVLLNGLTNVERYAYPPGVGGRVVVRASIADGERLTVEVRDFGRGLTAEDNEHAFDPFFTTGRACGGTGLGLAIVRNIVSGPLQGEVFLHSRPGEGTSLCATFPRCIETQPVTKRRSHVP